MLKKYLCTLCFFSCTLLYAQDPSFARIIKIAAADSLVTLKETVKARLYKTTTGKKQDDPLRLLISSSDKTASSNISRWLAAKQQQDMYKVDLSALVSKYIGETEKNLELLFSKAAEKKLVLFFDEADALFGKRNGEGETSRAAASFMKYCNAFKGTVLISCSSKDCLSAAASQKFITVGAE